MARSKCSIDLNTGDVPLIYGNSMEKWPTIPWRRASHCTGIQGPPMLRHQGNSLGEKAQGSAAPFVKRPFVKEERSWESSGGWATNFWKKQLTLGDIIQQSSVQVDLRSNILETSNT